MKREPRKVLVHPGRDIALVCLLLILAGCTDTSLGPVVETPGGESPPPTPPDPPPNSPFPPNQGTAELFILDGYDPAWSPDGTRIAFVSARDGSPAIYLAQADGAGATRLTAGSWPAWSPDGRKIAFHREGDFPWGDGEILAIGVDGSDETALIQGEFPAWSPDGRRIVFADAQGISVMNADGSGSTRLLKGDFLPVEPSIPNGIGKPTWSPDGRSIAFEHVGSDEFLTPAQIYVMNADGSRPRRLTPTSGIQFAESDPSWSPDGSRIVLWSFGYGIATVGANGGVPSIRYKNFPTVHYGARPSWSPDGRFAFTANRCCSGALPAIWIVGGDQ